MTEKDLELKINELKNAVYFLSEQIEKNRRNQKENFEEYARKIEAIDAVNIAKVTQDYNRKTDLLVGAMGSLIGKLESTEKNVHALQTKELHEMNMLLLKVLTQIRDNQHLTADALSNLAHHVANQDKTLKSLQAKSNTQKSAANKRVKGSKKH